MNKRKRYTSRQKVEIVREYLENQVPISELSDRYEINPNLIYKWKKELFEKAESLYAASPPSQRSQNTSRVRQLEKKLQDRDALIADIVKENIRLKKRVPDGVFPHYISPSSDPGLSVLCQC